METRSSHFFVGLFVLVSSILLAGFAVWLAKTDIDQSVDTYQVVFGGSVQGLQEGSQVRYRGVPVGRVRRITIDPNDVGQVLATIEVDGATPVKTDTSAQLALKGVTGLADIELFGGSNTSPPLEADDDDRPPRIRADASAIQQVVESTPQLLARAVELLERAGTLLSEENVEAAAGILANADAFTETLAGNRGEFATVLSETSAASVEVHRMVSETGDAVADIGELATTLKAQVDELGATGTATLSNVNEAAAAFENLSARFDTTLASLQRPLDDFGQSGLYDFSEMVREMRSLVASLSRISREFERDPTGFLIGGSQRGFTPE